VSRNDQPQAGVGEDAGGDVSGRTAWLAGTVGHGEPGAQDAGAFGACAGGQNDWFEPRLAGSELKSSTGDE